MIIRDGTVRASRTDIDGDAFERLIRAVWRAARWLANPASLSLAAETLSQRRYLNMPAEVIERALFGQITISQRGETREVPGFVQFFSGPAGFPWRSQAQWIGRQLAARTGLDREGSARAAGATFRTDIYRAAMRNVTQDIPSASSKIEGSLAAALPVGSHGGRLILPKDAFFDGRTFEPLED